uniref:Uncharacterized protein n=1 Tax=Triticum urartu TaxID=4572 RepID=A0A8R7UBG7_TRIUA
NFEQCPHQGNNAKERAIARYDQLGSNLWFSPRSSRLGTTEVPPNRSSLVPSPPLFSIPVVAYAHGPCAGGCPHPYEQADKTRQDLLSPPSDEDFDGEV